MKCNNITLPTFSVHKMKTLRCAPLPSVTRENIPFSDTWSIPAFNISSVILGVLVGEPWYTSCPQGGPFAPWQRSSWSRDLVLNSLCLPALAATRRSKATSRPPARPHLRIRARRGKPSPEPARRWPRKASRLGPTARGQGPPLSRHPGTLPRAPAGEPVGRRLPWESGVMAVRPVWCHQHPLHSEDQDPEGNEHRSRSLRFLPSCRGSNSQQERYELFFKKIAEKSAKSTCSTLNSCLKTWRKGNGLHPNTRGDRKKCCILVYLARSSY